jgi:uncharacterized surface protein with fasciclin (FAS1) repeats
MRSTIFRYAHTLVFLLTIGLTAPAILAEEHGYSESSTIVEILSNTDGSQAVVAAVLVVDEAGALPFSLAELLGDRHSEVVLFAPNNAAFEKLLGLEPGFLNGLSVGDIKAALPSLLPSGVGAEQVAAILLKHASLPDHANLSTASEDVLLANGKVAVADESVFTVGIGVSGVQINNETTIIKADVLAVNGVVHHIDMVIVDGLL